MGRPIRVIDKRNKHYFVVDDAYLNGYARLLGPIPTVVYFSLCRHVDRDQSAFPSQEMIAQEVKVGVRSVINAIALLKEWNIIDLEREKTEHKWARNSYFLLDKSVWKKPSGAPSAGEPSGAPDYIDEVQVVHTKDTHKKDTHIIPKGITKQGFGNQDINFLISYFKEKLQLPLLDGSDKTNRNYCWLAMKKFGGVEKVKLLIDATSQDKFWATKITSFQQLYYKGVQIISDIRGGKLGEYSTR